jgi:hypothetical protein
VHVQWCAVHIEPTPARREVVADLVVRIGWTDAAVEVLEGIRSGVPGYERLPADVANSEVLESCRRNLRQWASWLLSGATPPEEELDRMRASVRARASEGVPLEDLLDAYRLGGRLGWQILRRHARPHEQAALLDAAELLMTYIDRACAIVTEAYLDAGHVLVAEEERHVRSLLAALLRPGPVEDADLAVARRLGVPLRDAYVPFAVAARDASAPQHAAIAARLRVAGRAIAVTEGDRVFGLAWDRIEPVDAGEGDGVLLARDGVTARAILDAAREEVLLLVDRGRRAGLHGTVTVEDHLPELLLGRAPRLSERLRAQVVDALSPELLETLEALVACGLDRSATSARLHVHRNTLAYRVARIEQLAGLDLGTPRDIARAYLALEAA